MGRALARNLGGCAMNDQSRHTYPRPKDGEAIEAFIARLGEGFQCEHCKFFDYDASLPDQPGSFGRLGRCVRRAPTVRRFGEAWPVVPSVAYCGSFVTSPWRKDGAP